MADQFTEEDIRYLLGKLDTELQSRGLGGTIFIVGGAAMALAYNASRATADIDAILQPRDVLLDAAAEVARQENLGPRWLSDGVLQVMPPRQDDHPQSWKVGPALSVNIASADYVLAMKAMTSRQSDGDLRDAAQLCRLLGIAGESEIEAVVHRYFGSNTKFGAQELFFERIIAHM